MFSFSFRNAALDSLPRETELIKVYRKAASVNDAALFDFVGCELDGGSDSRVMFARRVYRGALCGLIKALGDLADFYEEMGMSWYVDHYRGLVEDALSRIERIDE